MPMKPAIRAEGIKRFCRSGTRVRIIFPSTSSADMMHTSNVKSRAENSIDHLSSNMRTRIDGLRAVQ